MAASATADANKVPFGGGLLQLCRFGAEELAGSPRLTSSWHPVEVHKAITRLLEYKYRKKHMIVRRVPPMMVKYAGHRGVTGEMACSSSFAVTASGEARPTWWCRESWQPGDQPHMLPPGEAGRDQLAGGESEG